MSRSLFNFCQLKYLLSFILATSLFACIPTEKRTDAIEVNAEEVKEDKLTTEQPLSANASVKDSAIKDKNSQVKKTVFGKKTLSFNGEKFEYSGGLVSEGTKLFNIQMAEHGMVKGSFVVVTKPSVELVTTPVELKSKAKLAKDTYRIIPKKGQNLQAIYKLLKANQQLLQVELEIDYSPKRTIAEF